MKNTEGIYIYQAELIGATRFGERMDHYNLRQYNENSLQ